MTLASGSRLGPYEILSPLGAGGMGEVYRAKDTRLDRTVAMKVLPSHLSQNEEIRQRFEREAKIISRLSHPHICALYDVGNQDGVEYLVMELLEGETLSNRLAKGPLSPEETLRYGIEIADALDKAHRQGIVHRDLKPGNVMLTKSGVKLLDFGLAKAIAPVSFTSGLSVLPTQAQAPLTQEGTILGTFQYMAPEQLEGKEADARTDIFAFGAVLYEMATGQKAFLGSSQASLISLIMSSEPSPISKIAPMTPPAIDYVVKSCLAKDPDERWQSAHDAKLQLRWIAEGGHPAGAPAVFVSHRRSRVRLAWTVAAVTALLALALTPSLVSLLSRSRAFGRMVQTSLLPPEKSTFIFDGGSMVLSPDGTGLAFVASTLDGRNVLWVRPLNGMSAQPLAGTDDASYPFWSPDSRFLGFFATGTLKKIDTSGGPPQTLCDAPSGRGGTWNRGGVIVFSPSGRGPLMQVSSTGGTPVPLAEVDVSKGELSHRFPFFLPDGRHFLYLAFSSPSVDGKDSDIVYAGSLDSKERKLLVRASSNAIYAPSSAGASQGYLLFARQRAVVALPFDSNALRVTGEAVPIGASVSFFDNTRLAVFTASNTGSFAYQSGGAGTASQLVWLDRTGKQLEVLGTQADYRRLRLSNDGRRVAVVLGDPQTGRFDVWIIDFLRHNSTRLTFGPTNNVGPVWSPDDSQIAFASNRQGFSGIYRKASSGRGEQELLVSSDKNSQIPTDWSQDGKFLAYSVLGTGAKGNWDIFTFSFAEKKGAPLVATPSNEYEGAFSPNGRWFTYVSEESGKPQVYVQPYPATGGKWQISTAGGNEPIWGRDGNEIFYVSLDNKLMAADVKTSSGFEAGTPRVLFETGTKSEGGRAPGRMYDASPDGRFLINAVVGEVRAAPITLVQNWAAELKK
jgi:serine/threonine protein kinase/Tol biopolymer transport system component